MKNKKLVIPIALLAFAMIATATIYFTTLLNPRVEPVSPDESGPAAPVEPVEAGDYIATDYPRDLPVEAVSGVLGSLNAYADNILSPDFDVAAFLDYSYQNQILRFNITETGGEAALVTKDNAGDFGGEKNPLRATKQLVMYAANSGHTINNLSIKDEMSTAGVKDFSAYLGGTAGDNTLTEQARSEIIK